MTAFPATFSMAASSVASPLAAIASRRSVALAIVSLSVGTYRSGEDWAEVSHPGQAMSAAVTIYLDFAWAVGLLVAVLIWASEKSAS